MWYVVQVRTGQEEKLCFLCEQRIPDKNILQRSFIPYFEEKKKIHGSWELIKKRLFPGYIFLVTDNLEELRIRLRAIPNFTRFLSVDDEIIPLTDEEVRFLNHFGGEEQLVPISEGIIEGGHVHVIDGPLKGYEGMICHIDRHKRKAKIEVEMFHRKQQVEVGLEIVAKS